MKNPAAIVLSAFASSLVTGSLICTLMAAPGGIYPSNTGEAVYIQGESCTINMEPDDNDFSRQDEDFKYCQKVHACYYGDLKNTFQSVQECIAEGKENE
jgi:hypothetical protein